MSGTYIIFEDQQSLLEVTPVSPHITQYKQLSCTATIVSNGSCQIVTIRAMPVNFLYHLLK